MREELLRPHAVRVGGVWRAVIVTDIAANGIARVRDLETGREHYLHALSRLEDPFATVIDYVKLKREREAMTSKRPTCHDCGAPGTRDEFERTEYDCMCGKTLMCSECGVQWEYRPTEDARATRLCDYCTMVYTITGLVAMPEDRYRQPLRDLLLAFRREWREWDWEPGSADACAFDDTVEALEWLFAAYMGPAYTVDLESGMATRKKGEK